MKKLLLAGAGGYIGSAFAAYLNQNFPGEYELRSIRVRADDWKREDFSGFDSLLDFAGIAHIAETTENAHLYYEVNRDLAAALAEKAKSEGVGQFVYLSSMSVYGMETGSIHAETPPSPVTHYGKSKLQAERLLQALASDSFRVAILRPPMVYGEACKGNYAALVKIAERVPVFPSLKNQRSAVRIELLCAFLEQLVRQGDGGLFYPQDEQYLCTSDTVRRIAQSRGKSLRLCPALNPFVRLAMCLPGKIGSKARKAFGDLIYDQGMSPRKT